jgi:hypothetical protein
MYFLFLGKTTILDFKDRTLNSTISDSKTLTDLMNISKKMQVQEFKNALSERISILLALAE